MVVWYITFPPSVQAAFVPEIIAAQVGGYPQFPGFGIERGAASGKAPGIVMCEQAAVVAGELVPRYYIDDACRAFRIIPGGGLADHFYAFDKAGRGRPQRILWVPG